MKNLKCSKCRWQNTCYSDPTVWDLSPQQESIFMIAKNRCISAILGESVQRPEDILRCEECEYENVCDGPGACIYVV